MSELFISVDVETDGPCPIVNSMLSLGAVVFTVDEVMEDRSFAVNLQTLPDAVQNQETMDWWAKQGNAYALTRIGATPANLVMNSFAAWVENVGKTFKSRPVFAAYPAGFDFTFVYVYLNYFGYKSPFGFQSWDAKSYASAIMRKPFRETIKKNMPKEWFSARKHTHGALDDAIEQAYLFQSMIRAAARP